MLVSGGYSPGTYVSHIVCRAGSSPVPGFAAISQIGQLETRKLAKPPVDFHKLAAYSRNMWHDQIDGKFTITVKPMALDKPRP
jgi:hypothetical protein